jgi:hypothetical protein
LNEAHQVTDGEFDMQVQNIRSDQNDSGRRITATVISGRQRPAPRDIYFEVDKAFADYLFPILMPF